MFNKFKTKIKSTLNNVEGMSALLKEIDKETDGRQKRKKIALVMVLIRQIIESPNHPLRGNAYFCYGLMFEKNYLLSAEYESKLATCIPLIKETDEEAVTGQYLDQVTSKDNLDPIFNSDDEDEDQEKQTRTETARRFYEFAHNLGNPNASYRLAVMCLLEIGGEQEIDLARNCLKKVVEAKHAKSFTHLDDNIIEKYEHDESKGYAYFMRALMLMSSPQFVLEANNSEWRLQTEEELSQAIEFDNVESLNLLQSLYEDMNYPFDESKIQRKALIDYLKERRNELLKKVKTQEKATFIFDELLAASEPNLDEQAQDGCEDDDALERSPQSFDTASGRENNRQAAAEIALPFDGMRGLVVEENQPPVKSTRHVPEEQKHQAERSRQAAAKEEPRQNEKAMQVSPEKQRRENNFNTDALMEDLKKNPKIKELFAHLSALAFHGDKMKHSDRRKGVCIDNLARTIDEQLKSFIVKVNQPNRNYLDDEQEFKELKKSITKQIESEFPLLQKHRSKAAIIAVNFLIALTGIGLIALVYRAAVHRKQGSPFINECLFFGRTASEKKCKHVENLLDKVEIQAIRMGN